MIKYIIFDFDGTLVDSLDIAINAVNKLSDKFGFKKVKKEEFDFLRKLSIPERCKHLSVPMYKLPFWAAHFYNEYKSSIQDIALFEGIKEVLDELRNRGYELAIISSNSEDNIREFLEKNQIYSIKEVFASKHIFGKDKVLNAFMKKEKLSNSEIIYVGDEERDILACKKVGVKIISVSWGFDLLETIKQKEPDYIVNSPEEILSIV
ncbi:HAD-superfamily hydrolase, subfamily IA, variant 1 [Alkaliphilus metalliredigens QYMF]|uniref:HAD-superfamily hydrolase, subfamily IA, variant 1 n=1 Tax=Alkaliphilus metalliredigens (strain QYMF) TaxID=293826 RepID=A6TSC2_ALKMQ|nr:HAD-IA family hydrolase [Alkaliphilus metalliredigens]ABR49090.1 HAD-superfamily hydrolase, subfamily IA, variant 1 [Alkaliphilus metalliredigens QYMF]